MEQNQSKFTKDEQTEEETYKEEPFEEEQIEEDEEEEPYEEEPIEDEPSEEEPIEEEPYEEEPIEEEPSDEEPIEEEPFEEEPTEEEPSDEEPIEEEGPLEEEQGEQVAFQDELTEEDPLEEEPIEEQPLEESAENKTSTKHLDSSLEISKKRKRVKWDVNLVTSVTDSQLAKSSVTPDPRPRPQCTTEASKGIDMTNLYVAKLPQYFTADQLIGLFVRFGSIEKARMVTEKADGVGKNYGLVKFADAAHAEKALKEMNGYLLEGKELYVSILGLSKQIDEANLYVGNLPLYINKYSLRSLFERYGSIVQANVVVDEAGVSKGFGFVKFEDPAHAAKAMARLNGLALEDKAICVRIAGVAPEYARKVTTQMTKEVIQQRDEANLYVSNLPPSLDKSGLVKLFERFGPVVQARVNLDMFTKISRCTGFVRFSDVGHAAEAIKGMNNSLVEGKVIAVKVADPPRKHLGSKPDLFVQRPGCPSGWGSSHSGMFVYGPSPTGFMVAQNGLTAYGSGPWAYDPGALSSMPMLPFLGHGIPTNGAQDMSLHGLYSSDIMPTPDDLANFSGFRKSTDL